MKQVLINGLWGTPPTDINIGEWLNEGLFVLYGSRQDLK